MGGTTPKGTPPLQRCRKWQPPMPNNRGGGGRPLGAVVLPHKGQPLRQPHTPAGEQEGPQVTRRLQVPGGRRSLAPTRLEGRGVPQPPPPPAAGRRSARDTHSHLPLVHPLCPPSLSRMEGKRATSLNSLFLAGRRESCNLQGGVGSQGIVRRNTLTPQNSKNNTQVVISPTFLNDVFLKFERAFHPHSNGENTT